MKLSAIFPLSIAVALSCAVSGCQSQNAVNGSGYQLVRFQNPKAALATQADPKAGPAIVSNNAQCRRDQACRK